MSDIKLIAACGMNCGVCLGYLRTKNKCCGCRIDGNKVPHCLTCSIVNCEYLSETASGFCFDCTKYPCRRLKQLDKRYRQNYKTSLTGNLEIIKVNGLKYFAATEALKWRCSHCGGTVCIHRGYCLECGQCP